MKETKHTPGPWVTHDDLDDWQVDDADGTAIASVFRRKDARLIAAAPELLEAGQALHDAIVRLRFEGAGERPYAGVLQAVDAWEEAIDKAVSE